MPFTARPRLALFSPMPPARTGVAVVSAELAAALRADFDVDAFADVLPAPGGADQVVLPAHDFLWRHAQRPYDLTIYQLGNSSTHEFVWPYAFRFPGLIVFHDACLHHARAAGLLRAARRADYRAEFAANHPDASPDAAELAVAGFDSPLLYRWPMRRLLLQRARTAAVHARPLARALGAEVPEAEIRVIRLAHGVDVDEEERQRRRGTARARLGLEPGAIVFGVFGGLSPEKRLPQVLRAFAALRGFEPSAVLLLAGERARHYDLDRDLDRAGVREATVATGYVDSDEALTDAICASDVALTLRWPSAGELSGPWLRCLGAGVPTVVTQLPQLVDVPWLDPRTWTGTAGLLYGESTPDTNAAPVCVAIDILDEDHSLLLAMRRLARDAALRERVGRAGRQRWRRHHALPLMVDDYHRAIAAALARPAPAAALPAHLLAAGDRTLAETVARFGLANPLR